MNYCLNILDFDSKPDNDLPREILKKLTPKKLTGKKGFENKFLLDWDAKTLKNKEEKL
jgi:hypothetical protein